MEHSGWTRPDQVDRVVVRGDRDKGEFVAFWLADPSVPLAELLD
jgi:hypothetical protein